ncbi:MAG: hypothetical protein HY835_07055 [Anaerolineae bacterium]|nr:hypothetical protein [Anaerolineae bacterium]
MNSRLIIVDGHSSVGKSSISNSVYRQVNLRQPAYWLHEECEAHPIRHEEFSFGALDTAEGMQRNRAGMLKKWADFRDSIRLSGKICVTEGCLLHAYDRYFIHSLWDDQEILAYYLQVMEVIQELNPILVFLHRPDLRKSLEKAFVARGQWWRDLMLKRDDLHVYFKDHTYVDENSMFDAIAFEQSQMMAIFDRLPCQKIKIDTSEEQWEQYVGEILAFMGSTYQVIHPYPCDLAQYAGTYRWVDGAAQDEWVIRYDETQQCLYSTLFWPYMPMRCTAENVFEFISFPVQLVFEHAEHGMQFRVHGNYEWEYNDQLFRKA